MKIQRVLVIPDVQMPYQCLSSMRAVEKYMTDHKWDIVIYLGDFLDYFCISRFNEGKPGMLEGKSILSELNLGKTLFEKHLKILRKNNKDCKVYYLEGNHEARAYDFALRFPHLKGIIEPENILEFKKNNVTYIKTWSTNDVLTIGKATFIHGRYTNQHHAKKHVEAFEENVFYGHTHDLNSYNKTSHGTGKSKVGHSLGHLSEYPKGVDYTKGRPRNWQKAIATFYFLPDGHFNFYISRIFKGRFVSPEGNLYASTK